MGAQNRMKFFRAPLRTIAAVLLCTFSSGCAIYFPPEIFPQEQRERLGRLAIAATNQAPSISLDVTTSRGHSAAKSARAGALASIQGGFQAGGGGAIGPALGILLAPVFAVGGAVYGTFAGPSANEVEVSLPPLEKLLLDEEYQQALKMCVLEAITARTSWTVTSANTDSSEPAITLAIPNADTVMEVGIKEIGLTDAGVTNSSVILAIGGFAKLIRIADGTVISTAEYRQYSAIHSLEAWGQDGGILVRKELLATINSMAEHMVSDHLLTATQRPQYFSSLQPASFTPEPCLFCDYGPIVKEDRSLEFCWVPFPAPEDVADVNGTWLRNAEDIVYDFRILEEERRWVNYSNPVMIRFDINKSCYTPENKIDPCQEYVWSVRARFRVSEKMYATPWVTRYERNTFKTECE